MHFFPHFSCRFENYLLLQTKCDVHKRSALNRCVFSNKIYPCDSTKELLRCADGAQVHKEHLVLTLLLAWVHLRAAIFFGDCVKCEAERRTFPRLQLSGAEALNQNTMDCCSAASLSRLKSRGSEPAGVTIDPEMITSVHLHRTGT